MKPADLPSVAHGFVRLMAATSEPDLLFYAGHVLVRRYPPGRRPYYEYLTASEWEAECEAEGRDPYP